MLSGLSTGWIIAGIAAIGLPIVAHLLSRRGGRTVLFPAVQFVMRAAAEHARRHRFRDILLLLLRAGAIALIALAFDRPVWLTRAAGAADAREGRDVVILLDASASMSRTERGRTLYDAAKERAGEVLDSLDWSRDRAGVIFMGLGPRPALPRLSANHDALASRIRESAVTAERGDLAGALALASTMPGSLDMDQSKPRPRQIVVIADRQRTQWEDGSAPVGARALPLGVGPQGPTPNLAVTGLTIVGADPLVAGETVVSATVANFAGEAGSSRTPRVVLREVGDDGTARELGATVPTIGPDGLATLSFVTSFDSPGPKALEVAIIDDAFTLDDIARTVINVADTRRVVLITRARPADLRSAAYFFEAALAPDASAPYRVERVAPEDVVPSSLAGAPLVIVVEADALPDTTIDVIRDAGRAGGAILWVADSPASATALARLTENSSYFNNIDGMRARPEGVSLADAPFKRSGTLSGPIELALRAVTFRLVCDAAEGSSGFVEARFTDGRPWMLAGPIGDGAGRPGGGLLVTILGALDPGASTLVKGPVFPILVGEMAKLPAGTGRADTTAHVGEPVVIPLLADPRGALRVEPGGVPRVVDDAAQGLRVAVDGVNTPGFVTVRDDSPDPIGIGAVNLDPRESDLRTLSDAEIEAILSGVGPLGEASDASAALDAIARRRPIELWPPLMVGAVLLLATEGLIATARARAREREPRHGAPA